MQHNERQRIIGIENEWSVVYKNPNNPREFHPLPQSGAEALLKDFLPEDLAMPRTKSGGMASNGMRIYREMMSFVEIATAEEASLTGAVASDIASERIIAGMVDAGIEAGVIPQSSRINKRVISDYAPPDSAQPITQPKTWGYHVNFGANAEKLRIRDESMMPLALHLATMNIYAGAGMLRHYEPGMPYVIGQKTLQLNSLSSNMSHGNTEPLLSSRTEHHADSTKHLRIHVTSMDPHISPWATWISIGTTSIVIRLMEEGYLADDIIGDTPLHEIAKAVGSDTTLTNKYKMAEGRELSAIDIQDHLYQKASQLNLSPDEAAIMPEWRRALDTLAQDPNLLVEADWVMRRKLIKKKAERAGAEPNSAVAWLWNNEYDTVYRQPEEAELQNGRTYMPLVHFLRSRSIFANHMPPHELIESRVTTPPPETRAHIRGRLIARHIGEKSLTTDWGRVRYEDEDGNSHDFGLTNPYDNVNEHETVNPPIRKTNQLKSA